LSPRGVLSYDGSSAWGPGCPNACVAGRLKPQG